MGKNIRLLVRLRILSLIHNQHHQNEDCRKHKRENSVRSPSSQSYRPKNLEKSPTEIEKDRSWVCPRVCRNFKNLSSSM